MRIDRDTLDDIERHARQALPDECCGVLLAAPGDPDRASRVIRSENAERCLSRERYALDPRAHIKAVEMEIAGHARIVGYYHSHPAGRPVPSAVDKERAVPGILYLITAPDDAGPRHAAWQLQDDHFVPVPLEVSA